MIYIEDFFYQLLANYLPDQSHFALLESFQLIYESIIATKHLFQAVSLLFIIYNKG